MRSISPAVAVGMVMFCLAVMGCQPNPESAPQTATAEKVGEPALKYPDLKARSLYTVSDATPLSRTLGGTPEETLAANGFFRVIGIQERGFNGLWYQVGVSNGQRCYDMWMNARDLNGMVVANRDVEEAAYFENLQKTPAQQQAREQRIQEQPLDLRSHLGERRRKAIEEEERVAAIQRQRYEQQVFNYMMVQEQIRRQEQAQWEAGAPMRNLIGSVQDNTKEVEKLHQHFHPGYSSR